MGAAAVKTSVVFGPAWVLPIIHEFKMFLGNVDGEGGVDIQGFDVSVVQQFDAVNGVPFTGSGVPSENVLV